MPQDGEEEGFCTQHPDRRAAAQWEMSNGVVVRFCSSCFESFQQHLATHSNLRLYDDGRVGSVQ